MIALDECGLKTQWEGDQYCINPPPPDKGFQIRIGPTSYDNPEPQYVMQPGDETVENIPVTSGNASDVYYYFRQYRMRPGSHHLIVYSGASGGKRLGGSQNLAKDNPEGGVIAPENQGVGMPLAANTPLTINLHYFNNTNHPILKEAWVNFWYRDPQDVTDPATEVFSPTPMNVAPGQHVLIHGSCPISGSGHALNLYGHRHANNLRFSIWHGGTSCRRSATPRPLRSSSGVPTHARLLECPSRLAERHLGSRSVPALSLPVVRAGASSNSHLFARSECR